MLKKKFKLEKTFKVKDCTTKNYTIKIKYYF